MSDYAWFAVKGVFYLILIGFAVWVTGAGWWLLTLVLMPSWTNDDCDCRCKNNLDAPAKENP